MMPLLDSHRCTMFRDFTGERQSSQSVLLSICGYSLASDAGGKEFGTAAAGGPSRENRGTALGTISSTEISRRNAELVLKSTIKAG